MSAPAPRRAGGPLDHPPAARRRLALRRVRHAVPRRRRRASGCGQLAGEAVGMLATVVDADGELRLVIAQRTGRGDWTPIRTMSATRRSRAVASARPDATGPAPTIVDAGGLW